MTFIFGVLCKITLELICSTRTLRDDRELHIHPNSVLFGEKPPKWSVHVPTVASCPINKAFLLLTYSFTFIGCSRECTYIYIFTSVFHFLLTRVVFNEVVQTAKYYMRDVTAVESSWLVELAPHFYKQAKVGQRKKTVFSSSRYLNLWHHRLATALVIFKLDYFDLTLTESCPFFFQHGSLASKRSRVL